MIYYSLSQVALSDKIINDIAKLVSGIPKDQLPNYVLTISLKEIVNYAEDNPLPKITCE
jgi:hypothetical protein